MCVFVCSRFLVGVFKILGPLRWTPILEGPPPTDHPPPLDGPSARPPKISLFCCLSRRKFHSFFSLWEVFSLNFGGVFEKGRSNVHVWALGLSCETPAAPKPPGLHCPPATAWPRALSGVGATKFASQQSPNPLPKKGKGNRSWMKENRFCRSSERSMVSRQVSCGRTTLVKFTLSHREKVGSKGTR